MLRDLKAFIDERVGFSDLRARLLAHPLAGGPRWALVFGSVLVWLFALELVTGLALMTVYAPSAQTAWSSCATSRSTTPARTSPCSGSTRPS